jgi:O-antigen ligase
MDFVLFILATAILFLRPQDFVPEWTTVPLYLVFLLVAALVASGSIVRQLHGGSLGARPVTVCVIGLLVAIVVSHLSHSLFWEARTQGTEFAKVLLYYLLLVGVVNTAERLRSFLVWLAVFFAVVTALSLLQYHGTITLPQATLLEQAQIDEETGDVQSVTRLCGYGLFNDPNDLCLLLVSGMGIAAYFATDRRRGWQRLGWFGLIALFGYGLALTQSRGGFLALLVGLLVLLYARFGMWKAALAGGLAVPIMLFAFAGRQTDISASDDTGQSRVQLWSEALELFKQEPLLGIGQGGFEERVGLVAHNSFLHSFVELGFFGGALFLGAFFTALWGLYRLDRASTNGDRELRRLGQYLLAIIAAYAVGLMSLSRAYIAPTYLMLGLATAYFIIAGPARPLLLPRFDRRYLPRLAFVSAAFLLAMHVFVRTTLNRG